MPLSKEKPQGVPSFQRHKKPLYDCRPTIWTERKNNPGNQGQDRRPYLIRDILFCGIGTPVPMPPLV